MTKLDNKLVTISDKQSSNKRETHQIKQQIRPQTRSFRDKSNGQF